MMNPSLDSQPGSSKETGNNFSKAIQQSNQVANKLDQLTSEEVDKFIHNESLAQYKYSGDRHLLIFDKNRIEEELSPSNIEEPGDEFFELSTVEAKKLLRDIIRTRDQLENGQLMTKAMRELNSAKRTLATLHQYNYSVVRLHLPSGLVLQALFKPLENIDKVKAFFNQLLIQPDLDFYIYFTPPKTILEGGSTLLDLRCVPTANFYFGVDESEIQSGLSSHISQPVQHTTESVTNHDGKSVNGDIGANPTTSSQENNAIKDSVIEPASEESSSLNEEPVEAYVRPDVVAKHLVLRSIADAKAAEFRRAKNPALHFMDEPHVSALAPSSQSPQETITPASNLNRPRTSADKIPKWFKPGK